MSEAEYFHQLRLALDRADIAKPILVIDLERLRENIRVMKTALPQAMGYRIVAKSLACEKLLREVRHQAGSDRLMVFSLDHLLLLAQIMPECDFLLGKPLPIKAVRHFLTSFSTAPNDFKIEWLVDSCERIEQYGALAREARQKLALNLEIDVGLHRGGFSDEADLKKAFALFKDNSFLRFSGFMGYEPHLAALPDEWRNRATKAAWDFYHQALNSAESAGYDLNQMTRNAGGSPTYRFYQDKMIANELCVGSALLKPKDFDYDVLKAHIPALFIATPILKTAPKLHYPAWETAPAHIREKHKADKGDKQMIFIYGGNWLAEPIFPQGLAYNQIFGRSSNQEMLEAPSSCSLQIDDFVFLRPRQSEAILTHFGPLAIYDQKEIIDFWDVFPSLP